MQQNKNWRFILTPLQSNIKKLFAIACIFLIRYCLRHCLLDYNWQIRFLIRLLIFCISIGFMGLNLLP